MKEVADELQVKALHHVDATHAVFKYDRQSAPAVRVSSGDVVVLECNDSSNGAIGSQDDGPDQLDLDHINPATGPVYVDGAEPGDVLAVDILRLEVGDRGSAVGFPGQFGFLKHDDLEQFTKIAHIRNGVVDFRGDVRIPVRPSLGTFGVAPAGEPVSTLHPGDNGANMDHKDLCAGNTVYLPVFVSGALLSMGDAHGTIGDGELSGEGLEVSSVVTVRVRVMRGVTLQRPLIETPTEIMTCGWGVTIEEATTCAVRDMVDFLERKLKWPRVEAYSLLGMAADARLGNFVTTPGAVRVAVPKHIFTRGITVP